MSRGDDFWVKGEELEQFQDRLHKYIIETGMPPTRLSMQVIGNSAIHRALHGSMLKRTSLQKYEAYMQEFPDGDPDLHETRNYLGRHANLGERVQQTKLPEDEIVRRREEQRQARIASEIHWLKKEKATYGNCAGSMKSIYAMPA